MKHLRFALAAIALSLCLAVGTFFAADTYSHWKFDGVVGLNREGYRGPLVSHAHPDIKRIVVLGGSTAFGYGVPWQEAWPAQLEKQLALIGIECGDGNYMYATATGWYCGGTKTKVNIHPPHVQVVNLGYNAEGAAAFRPTLEDFAYLKPDLIILYEGYNDLAGSDGYGVVNSQVYRRQSPMSASETA